MDGFASTSGTSTSNTLTKPRTAPEKDEKERKERKQEKGRERDSDRLEKAREFIEEKVEREKLIQQEIEKERLKDREQKEFNDHPLFTTPNTTLPKKVTRDQVMGMPSSNMQQNTTQTIPTTTNIATKSTTTTTTDTTTTSTQTQKPTSTCIPSNANTHPSYTKIDMTESVPWPTSLHASMPRNLSTQHKTSNENTKRKSSSTPAESPTPVVNAPAPSLAEIILAKITPSQSPAAASLLGDIRSRIQINATPSGSTSSETGEDDEM